MTREQNEFRERLIVAAIQGITSNPVQVQEIGLQALANNVSPSKLVALLAVAVANDVIRILESDRPSSGVSDG